MSDPEERAARYVDLFEKSHDHGAECAYCPFCATLAVVRKTKPEILDHLAAAARELITAAGILIEEASVIVGGDTANTQDEPAEVLKMHRTDAG